MGTVNAGWAIGGGVSVALVAFLVGWHASRKAAQHRLASTEKLTQKLISDAKREAEAYKKEAILEAKDEWYKAKEKFEKETHGRRVELQKLEKKFSEREANLNRQVDILEKKDRELRKLESDLVRRDDQTTKLKAELERKLQEENAKLECIAEMTTEEAKRSLISNLESEARHEAARLIRETRERALRTAEKEAREVLTLAVQRSAVDHTVESTVSVVSLPNDDMKGRIIGREGRNIRAFETATGIDVIIDDTPEAVILSGFDPIRREIARIALERLIANGRIHPGRIEEVVGKVQAEMEDNIREAGEQALLELGIHGMHSELVRMLGRLRYRTSYGQNVLQHSIEVGHLSSIMAAELKWDQTIAKRSGLLHDIGKAVDHESEGTHAQLGAELLRKFNEGQQVVETVAKHHDDASIAFPIAVLVQAADAVSSARPGARRESLESYVKRLERLEHIADSFPGVVKSFAIQAGREIRIMVEHKEISDEQAQDLAHEISRKVERELEYPGQIKVVVIRETRAIEYAR